jgi:Zn-dependent protease
VTDAPTIAACPDCGTHLADGLLACPGCKRLVHASRLNQLAADATRAQQAGDVSESVRLWREALDLLPPDTQQHAAVAATITNLSRQIDANPAAATSPAPHGKSAAGKATGIAGAAALLLWKLKFVVIFLLTKAKLLVLGLGNLPTLLSMFVSMGAYWAAWGWKFAVGLVLSIYVHEMGHVAMLRRFGFKASAPMFIPGLGALIRLRQHPLDAREDARIGLAGPIWGLAAAGACAAVWYAAGWPAWGAVGKVGAWINLFNLTPIGSLDGGRGFRALSRLQSWIVVAAAGTLWFATHDGMLALVTIVAVVRALAKPKDAAADGVACAQFCFLLVALTLLSQLPVRINR